MSKTTVINIKDNPDWEAEGGVYIGRGHYRLGLKKSIFHNPFIIGKDGNRKEVLKKFEDYFLERVSDKEFLKKVIALEGKTLVCWCVPKDCHGKNIAAFIGGWVYQRDLMAEDNDAGLG